MEEDGVRRQDGAGPAVGLGAGVRACLFDLDGVLTRTSGIHARAWQKTFDTFLRAYDQHSMRQDDPFDVESDYEKYLDARPRAEGIRAFLGSRGIEVPEGGPDDAPATESVYGIGEAKQWVFLSLLEVQGPGAYEGAVHYLRVAREAGLPCAVVTSSANCGAVLAAAGIADLFDVWIDGRVVVERALRGVPAPDEYLAAAEALGVEPEAAAVFEGSVAGADAARAGGFGTVVGVDRLGGAEHRGLMRTHGADVVVEDPADLLGRRTFSVPGLPARIQV